MTIPDLPGGDKTGTIPFKAPGTSKACSTWYRTWGNLSSSTKTPVILLHGGPGACHEYLLPHIDLFTRFQTPVIFYDQLGNGASTRLPETMGDGAFWTPDLFRAELDNLIDHFGLRENGFDILGVSWGASFGSYFATYRPKGLRKLVLTSGPASMVDWAENCAKLYEELPGDVRDVIKKAEAEGKTEGEEYEAAMLIFYQKHLCRVKPWPDPYVAVALGHLEEDKTVYLTM